MHTPLLIHLLAQDVVAPERPGDLLAPMVVLGTLLAGGLFLATIGPRPDIAAALATPRFPLKFAITGALAATALGLVWRIGAPGLPLRAAARRLTAAPVLLGAAALAELMATPRTSWGTLALGQNALNCLTLIPLLSLGPLLCLILGLRRGAPADPGRAGAVAGLAASGIAATFYAANCTDDSPLFVLAWYPLAVALVAGAGFLIGRRVLRW